MIPLIIAGALTGALAYTFMGQNLVSASEAKRLIKEGKIKKIIDVRTITEYRAGHYPKARPLRNSLRRVYSSTAILDNGPDLRQRHWKNSVSKMSTTSPGTTRAYF